MKPIILSIITGMLTTTVTVTCTAQRLLKMTASVAVAAMNNKPTASVGSVFSSNTGVSNVKNILNDAPAAGGSSLFGSTTFNNNGAARAITIYTSAVTINYQIPGIVFFDWAGFRRDALAALSDGPGNPNNPNYLPGDVPALNALAYNGYLNPNAYGQSNLVIDFRQWNGNLNWFSANAGSSMVKNWVILFLPVNGHVTLIAR